MLVQYILLQLKANTVFRYGHSHTFVSLLYVTAVYGRVQGNLIMEEKTASPQVN